MSRIFGKALHSPRPVALVCGSRPRLLAPRETEPRRFRPDGAIRRGDLDPDAVKVIRRLNHHGFLAYLVGGCVRDLLLGQVPKDFDIATEATPRQVKRLFRNSRIIGRRFRLVHITFNEKVLEVATFRAKVDPPPDADDPMIRQDNVFGTAGSDARRRDFTINGLFYDVREGEVVDYVGGLSDLERQVIETIGNPWVRFREDPVRMLRAIKFAGRLRFRLADDVYQAILDCREDLRKAPAPRLLEEIIRILNRGGAHHSARLFFQTGLMEILLPELSVVLQRGFISGRVSHMWAWLQELDRMVRAGEEVSHVVMLACLLAHFFEDHLYDPDPATARDLNAMTEQVLRPIAVRLHMSRRDTYRLKQILIAQRRFTGQGRSRRRKPSVHQFMRREYFPDAFTLFRLHCRTSGHFSDELRQWEKRVRGA